MEIKEIANKLSKTVKDNKAVVIGGLVVGVGALALLNRGSATEDSGSWVVPTGTSGYPDIGTNSNVIIDEVNNHTTTEVDGVKDAIDNIVDNANKNTDTTIPDINGGSTGGGGSINVPDTTTGGKIQVPTPVPDFGRNWFDSGNFGNGGQFSDPPDRLPGRNTNNSIDRGDVGISFKDNSTSKSSGNTMTRVGTKTTTRKNSLTDRRL